MGQGGRRSGSGTYIRNLSMVSKKIWKEKASFRSIKPEGRVWVTSQRLDGFKASTLTKRVHKNQESLLKTREGCGCGAQMAASRGKKVYRSGGEMWENPSFHR